MTQTLRPRTALEDAIAIGIYDWITPDFLIQIARDRALPTKADERSFTMGLVTELLLTGIAVAGDIFEGKHRPWDMTPEQALGKIIREWDALGDTVQTFGQLGWLELTDKGKEMLRHIDAETRSAY